MSRTVENSVYLVKDLLLEGPGMVANRDETRVRILEKDVRPHLFAIRKSTSLTKAVEDCIKELQSGSVIRLHLKSDRRGYNIYLHKKLVQGLCNVLPEPSLQIRFRLHVPKSRRAANENTAVFEKCLDLTEALGDFKADGVWANWSRVYPVGESKDKDVSCDVILGWTETPKPKPIKIILTPVWKQLFEKEASKDLILIAGNGSEVKCHRVIFEAQSVVLATMVSMDNGMRESESGRVELKENSEDGLTRLVRYFYGFELTTEDLTCDIAMELLKTAHKYQLVKLMRSLILMILEREKDYFTPDGLLELYFHAKNLEESNDWKKVVDHSLQLMLSFTSEIQSCDGYKEITRTDPCAAAHLAWKLLELSTQQEARPPTKRKLGD